MPAKHKNYKNGSSQAGHEVNLGKKKICVTFSHLKIKNEVTRTNQPFQSTEGHPSPEYKCYRKLFLERNNEKCLPLVQFRNCWTNLEGDVVVY